jgi:hypothetical protein
VGSVVSNLEQKKLKKWCIDQDQTTTEVLPPQRLINLLALVMHNTLLLHKYLNNWVFKNAGQGYA